MLSIGDSIMGTDKLKYMRLIRRIFIHIELCFINVKLWQVFTIEEQSAA